MIKFLIIAGLIVGALIIGGVLEVTIHPERLAEVPSRVIGFISEPSTQARARTLLTDLKRRGEQLIIKDEEKRTKLALLYVTQDAAKLQEQVAEGDPATLLPQAELLAKSLQRAKTQLDSASIETLSSLREESRDAIGTAEATLQTLRQEHARYESIQEKFVSITTAIGENLAALRPSNGVIEPDVAGIQDEPTPVPQNNDPQFNAVPLNF